jgi:hypothetical protein
METKSRIGGVFGFGVVVAIALGAVTYVFPIGSIQFWLSMLGLLLVGVLMWLCARRVS